MRNADPTGAAALLSSHWFLHPLGLDGATIAGCCEAKQYSTTMMMHSPESTLTGWYNPATGKCL